MEIARSIVSEILFPCSQDSATGPCIQYQPPWRIPRRHVLMIITASLNNQPNETYVLRINFNIILPLTPSPPLVSSCLGFQPTTLIHLYHPSKRTPFPSSKIVQHLATLVLFGEKFNSFSFSLGNVSHLPDTSSLPRPVFSSAPVINAL